MPDTTEAMNSIQRILFVVLIAFSTIFVGCDKQPVTPPYSANQAPIQPQSVTVHITRTGKKYHSAGCSYLRYSDIEISLDEAKSRGLSPCSKCNPPQ